MKLNKVNFSETKYTKKPGTSPESALSGINSISDSVSISSSAPDVYKIQQEGMKRILKENKSAVPLKINFDIEGVLSEKTIMGSVSDKEVTLNFKHTNDVHGNMTSVANLIQPDEFWIDAGDTWQGYDFHSIISGGQEETDLMNKRGCDLAVPGNHFYDDRGLRGGKLLQKLADFPYICSNIEGMAPYVLAEVEGVKMAFVGVQTEKKEFRMVKPSRVKNLVLKDPIESVKKSVEEAKAKGADNIIVVSHLGLDGKKPGDVSDKVLAKEVPGIDLIIGGHSHTPTYDEVVVNGTRIVHAGLAGRNVKRSNIYIGDLSITVDKNTKKIKSIDDKLISVDPYLPLDDDIKQIRTQYQNVEDMVRRRKLGFTEGVISHHIKAITDTTLGNLISDALRKETGADAAILGSSFFSPLWKGTKTPDAIIPRGTIEMEDLLKSSLWMGESLDARVETWKVPGSAIKKLLEDGIEKHLNMKSMEGLNQLSGIRMKYDTTKPPGERISEILIGNKPLKAHKEYSLTTSHIQANWNPVLSNTDKSDVEHGRKIRHIVAGYIKHNSPITPEQDGRIHCIK